MSWRRAVNAALARVSGYCLVRAQAPPGPAKRATRRARRGALPKHFDEEARRIIREVRPRTMTSDAKLFALIVATRYVVDQRIAGDIVECGVWRGGSVAAVARTLL